jgi:ubiquinone/menaquinone biosynthesis C-methylase UbiE
LEQFGAGFAFVGGGLGLWKSVILWSLTVDGTDGCVLCGAASGLVKGFRVMFVLDVGCGNSPVGDVNCDLYSKDTEQHRSFDTANTAITNRNAPNFVVCSAEFLPFVSGCFDVAVSRQVIEHVAKPGLMASELVRVSRDLVIIETVHRRGERLEPRSRRAWYRKHHINKFDFTVFASMAKRLGAIRLKSDVLDQKLCPELFRL